MSHYLWEMRPYFRQVAGQLVLGSVNGIIMNTAVVLPAILLGRAVDTALALGRGEATSREVALAALLFVGGTLATEVPRIIKRWWLMTANGRIRANLRADALRGVFAWPMERIHLTPVGDLMARIIGDVEVLGVGVREFTIETWDTVLFSISLVVAMLIFDSGLTLMALLPVPFAFILAHASGRWVAERTTAAREANSALTSALQESISGVRLLRLFGRAPAAVDRVAHLSRHQADANLAVVRLRVGLQPIYAILVMAGVVLVLWQGGQRVVAGAMTVGALVAYLQLYLRFVERGYRIPQLVNSIQRGGAAYQRLRPLLAPPLSVRGEPRAGSFRTGHVAGINHPATFPHAKAVGSMAVTVEKASFRYPGAATLALEDVNLEIPAGALVAVTGPVGSGKSALARALVGLYPLESGAIRLDGRPVDTLSSVERAARTGYLPQDSYLFSGTIRENILFGLESDRGSSRVFPNGTQAGTERAVAVAALKSEVSTFNKGLETEIGELGVRVSGGQRQRIALARALAASAPNTPGLLVLDDPFSSVDVDTEAQIVAGLRRAFGPMALHEERATVVLFSHRLAAFTQADLVVVLDQGKIVEQGAHLELLRAGELYAKIFRAQSRLQSPTSTPNLGEVAT